MHDSFALRAKPQTALSPTTGRSRPWLGRRYTLLLIGSAVVLAGGFLSWNWLVALGLAPLLLSVLPCVAMCALGLCMSQTGRRACATDQTAMNQKMEDISIRGSEEFSSKEKTS